MPDRPGVNYPKFKEHFALLDFSAERTVPVISLFDVPKVTYKEEIKISVTGLDCKRRIVAWKELERLPRIKTKQPLICQIFNWAEEVRWEGWKLKTVLEFVNLTDKQNRYYAFYSSDNHYFETLSHKEAMDDRTLLVFGMEGKELPHEHGGPLRLCVPFLQGYKSVKWLSAIRSFKQDPLGIKILLEQSKTAKLAPEWKNRYGIGPLGGRVVDLTKK